MQLSEPEQTKLNQVRLDQSWKDELAEFLLSQKMDALRSFLIEEKNADIKSLQDYIFDGIAPK